MTMVQKHGKKIVYSLNRLIVDIEELINREGIQPRVMAAGFISRILSTVNDLGMDDLPMMSVSDEQDIKEGVNVTQAFHDVLRKNAQQ